MKTFLKITALAAITVALLGPVRLFASQPAEPAQTYHGTLTGGTFCCNGEESPDFRPTVTGTWNLIEARKDPNHRARRLAHGLLMLGSDAGFVATAAMKPDDDDESARSAHRAMAFTSIGMATAGYLIMLFGGD